MADTWTQVLDAINKVVNPDWGAIVAVIPILGVIGLLGPVLTLMAFAWLRYRLTRRAGRVRLSEVVVQTAPRDALGAPIVPPNVPFCPRDGLLYGPRDTRCEVCRDGLLVRCPVDATVRPVTRQVCSACGTRYVLGEHPARVAPRAAEPPAGGAAAA